MFINKSIFCICQNNDKGGILLFKISTHEQIYKIIDIKEAFSFVKCYDGNFLCCMTNLNNENLIVNYTFQNNSIIKINEIKEEGGNELFDLIELKDGKILSCGKDGSIKIWK